MKRRIRERQIEYSQNGKTLSDPDSAPKSDLAENSRSHPGQRAQPDKSEAQRGEVSQPAKKQRVGNHRRQNNQKQIGPRDIVSQVNQACSGQREFIRQSESAAHTIQRFEQVADQTEKQGPAFHPPDCAEIIDNAGMHPGKKTEYHAERKEPVEKHNQPALDSRDDGLHEAPDKIDYATTQ